LVGDEKFKRLFYGYVKSAILVEIGVSRMRKKAHKVARMTPKGAR
jgi:hypothetical protein